MFKLLCMLFLNMFENVLNNFELWTILRTTDSEAVVELASDSCVVLFLGNLLQMQPCSYP